MQLLFQSLSPPLFTEFSQSQLDLLNSKNGHRTLSAFHRQCSQPCAFFGRIFLHNSSVSHQGNVPRLFTQVPPVPFYSDREEQQRSPRSPSVLLDTQCSETSAAQPSIYVLRNSFVDRFLETLRLFCGRVAGMWEKAEPHITGDAGASLSSLGVYQMS